MRLLGILGAVLAIASASVSAAEVVTLAYPEFPGYLDAQGRGLYGDLMRAVFPAPQYELRVEIVPFARAMTMLAHSGWVVVPGNNDPGPSGVLSRQVTDIDVVSAAVRRSSFPDWQGESSLRDQRVSARLGYGYQRYTQVRMHYEEKHDLSAMLRMLIRSRVDIVLDYEPSIRAALERLPPEEANAIEIKHSVLQQPLHFTFRANRDGQSLREHFDAEFQRMARHGELRAIFQRHPEVLEEAYPPVLRSSAAR